jgi:hypothetical protein
MEEEEAIQSSGHDTPSMDGAVVIDANEVLRLTRSCTLKVLSDEAGRDHDGEEKRQPSEYYERLLE